MPTESNTIIQIRRSVTNSTPAFLEFGELGYSFVSNTLYIGDQNTNPVPVGASSTVANAAYNQANLAYTTANLKIFTFYQDTPPLTANSRDQWVNSNTGFLYVNTDSGPNTNWVEFGPTTNEGLPIQGATGSQGTAGAGTQGATGSQGTAGAGTQGATGSQGTAGAGTQGATGSQGSSGVGSQGSQGTIGPIGIQGLIGIQGNDGNSIQGTTGSQGTAGVQGITGIQGTVGIQGLIGLTGNDAAVLNIFSDSGLIFANTGNLNFTNSATINASVVANGTVGVNVSFSVNTSSDEPIGTAAYSQANSAYSQANTANLIATGVYSNVVLLTGNTMTGQLIIDYSGIGLIVNTDSQFGNTITVGNVVGFSFPHFVAQFNGNANSYLQVGEYNSSNGTNASADYIITGDVGNNSTYYLDIGWNNSGWSDPTFTIAGANSGYIYTSNGSLSIGTSNNLYDLILFAGGTLQNNEGLRVFAANNNVNVSNKLILSGQDIMTRMLINSMIFG